MFYKNLLLLLCSTLLGGLRLTTTTTTTTLVAAMSLANQDLERYFRTSNISQPINSLNEERIVIDYYNYAFLNFSYYTSEAIIETFSEEKARYGEGRIFSVTGKLVHISDSNDPLDDTACSANILGTGGETTPPSNVVWIALVRRGRCTFEEKVKNVYAKGALAIIIYNDKPVMNLEKMQIKGKTRNITAVITYQDIGLHMANIVDQGIDMRTSIIEGKKGSRPLNTLNRTSVLFVSISFIILMIISLVWLIAYYIQRFRYLQTKDQQSRQLCSVTKKAIMKIPTKTGKICDEKDADSDCCAICIEVYKPADCIRILPCKHEFHKNCIDPWLIEHRTCPMCKLDVLKFYGYVFLGSEESILEYEPSRNQTNASTAGANAIANGGALADLIRSRDFVIDFPRIFVLDGATTIATRESLFPTRLPERSQSALSLAQAHAKDFMSNMTNKLDEQHGIGRLRRLNARSEDHENLLNVHGDSIKKRRSRSADGRYSSGYFGRKEVVRQQQQQQQQQQQDDVENSTQTTDERTLRRRETLRSLTEASYAISRQRQQEDSSNASRTTSTRRSIRHTDVNIPLRDMLNRSQDSRESTPPILQLNGEEVDTD